RARGDERRVRRHDGRVSRERRRSGRQMTDGSGGSSNCPLRAISRRKSSWLTWRIVQWVSPTAMPARYAVRFAASSGARPRMISLRYVDRVGCSAVGWGLAGLVMAVSDPDTTAEATVLR